MGGGCGGVGVGGGGWGGRGVCGGGEEGGRGGEWGGGMRGCSLSCLSLVSFSYFCACVYSLILLVKNKIIQKNN